jgi:hypothetical protein
MVREASGEFLVILELLEIIILDLCLILSVGA